MCRRPFKKIAYLGLLILLTIQFFTDFIPVVNKDQFSTFQFDSEALAVGRIVKSKKDGLTSYSCFQGRLLLYDPDLRDFNAYYNKENAKGDDGYEPYYSQPGFQSLLYSCIAETLPMSTWDVFRICQLLNSLATAGVLLLFCNWVEKKWGGTTMILTYLFIFFSPWLVIFSHTIYWVPFFFFAPFILSLVIFPLIVNNKKNINKSTFWFFFLLIFIKFLFTGFEFITTTIISGLCPLVFYHVLNKEVLKVTFEKVSIALRGMMFGTTISLVLLLGQLTHQFKNVSYAFSYIIYSFSKRTFIESNKMDLPYLDSVHSNSFDVINTYLEGHFLPNCQNTFLQVLNDLCTFYSLIILLVAISSYRMFFETKSRSISERLLDRSLIAMLWFSLSSPLSWFVIFKGHAYIHTHIDFIVWYMPFMLIGYVVIAITIRDLFLRSKMLFKFKI